MLCLSYKASMFLLAVYGNCLASFQWVSSSIADSANIWLNKSVILINFNNCPCLYCKIPHLCTVVLYLQFWPLFPFLKVVALLHTAILCVLFFHQFSWLIAKSLKDYLSNVLILSHGLENKNFVFSINFLFLNMLFFAF